MERNREARRGTMAAAAATNGSGGGLPRRRQRNSSSFRDSPEEDGRMEMPDTSRLRDRGAKKDRDRDRSSRSRRRRGERMLHGSNRDRDEGDESSEESMDQDEEDEDEGMSVPVRLPPSSPPLPNPVAASSPQQNQQHNNHHHQQQQPPRKSFPPKAVKWKADEMIGVPVPRKARSASTKRAHEPPVTGGGGGGGGDHISHQASISPSRLSPISTTQLSPSSSNGSLRKKMKPVPVAKHRPPKFSKSASCQDEIEIEVAEVLFGMTRQFDSLPKQDSHKIDSRDIDGGSGNEAKSRVSSPSSVSPSPAAYSAALPSSNSCSYPASLPTVAPKRKRPRPVNFDEEIPTSLVVLHNHSNLSAPLAKVESENQIKPELSSPKSEKKMATPVKNGGAPLVTSVSQSGLSDVQRLESAKAEKCKIHDLLPTGRSNSGDRVETTEERVSRANGDSDGNLLETTPKKNAPEIPNEEKFKFDLMAPPPGKLSPEKDDFNVFDRDHKLQAPDIEMAPKMNKDKTEEKPAEIAVIKDEHQTAKFGEKDADLKKQTVVKQTLDLPLDLEKPKKEDVGFDKRGTAKQQAKDARQEPKQEKSGSASSLHVPLTAGSWPGGFPPYGYMGQVPPLQATAPINGTAGSSSSFQPPAFLQAHPRPKRCSTHFLIAQMISNYEKFARMNSFWTAAAGAAPFYGAKPCNQSVIPPSDSALSGHQMQGAFLGANAGALQDTKGTPVAALSLPGNGSSQEKMPQANNTNMETAQRKQVMLQQMPQSGSTSNMPAHGPAFIFPINQAQLLQPAAAASGPIRAGAAKSTTSSNGEIRNSAAISSTVGSGVAGGSATPVNLSFTNMLPNDAQYVAFLQNYGYPFPIPAQFTGAPFRGTSNAQAMPFFYPSHMLHTQQLRPQQQQQAGSLPHVQQTHQNPSTLNGSSHKHSQQSTNEFPATSQRQDLMSQQGHSSKGGDESLPSADGTISQSQKGIVCQTIFEPIHPQNFACVPNAAAIHVGGHADKQPIYHQVQHKQNMKAEMTPQAFTIPFASYGGAVSPPTGLDFSAIAQNHAILQSLPESSRHGYYQMASAPVAAPSQAAEQKKNNHVPEDGKTMARQSMNTNINDEEDRKTLGASKGTQHSSLSFVKADVDPAITSVLGNSINDLSSRQVNLIQPLTSRSSDRPACTTPASTSLTATTISNNSHQQQQQQQQHPIHLPKHQQQQLQMQHHLAPSRSKPSGSGSSVAVHPENLSGGATITMFPHALTGFPQALIQGGSSIQWPQGKSSTGRGVDPNGASPAPVVKNNFLQLQGRASQQPLPSQGHQTQISFGINGNKQGGQHLPGACGSPSPSSATVAVLSPSNSVSRSAGGSPRASSSVKPSSQSSAILLPQQTAVKQSTSSSSSKSNMNNSTMPSILGHHPQKIPAPSSVTKLQQQPQQPKQQSSEAQLFFSNPHMQQVQCAQSNASAQYYHKRPSEQTRQTQQQQQHNSVPSTSSMLSLCAPSALAQAGVPATADPTKAMSVNSLAAANNLKGLPPTSFLNAAQLAVAAHSASVSSRPPMSATFSYMSLPPFSVKSSAEQKPTARTDNLQACWQPESNLGWKDE